MEKISLNEFLNLKNSTFEGKTAFIGFIKIYHSSLENKELSYFSWEKLYEEWLYGDEIYE